MLHLCRPRITLVCKRWRAAYYAAAELWHDCDIKFVGRHRHRQLELAAVRLRLQRVGPHVRSIVIRGKDVRDMGGNLADLLNCLSPELQSLELRLQSMTESAAEALLRFSRLEHFGWQNRTLVVDLDEYDDVEYSEAFNAASIISQMTALTSLHLSSIDGTIPKAVPLAVATAFRHLRQLQLESLLALQDLRPLAALTGLETLQLFEAGMIPEGLNFRLYLPPISAFPRLRKCSICAPMIPVRRRTNEGLQHAIGPMPL